MGNSGWKTLDTAGMLKKESTGSAGVGGGSNVGGVTTSANTGPYTVPLGNPKKPTPMLRRVSPVGAPVYTTLPKPKKNR
jgi:hypothetical protein